MYSTQKNFSKASEFLWGTLNALSYATGLTYGLKISDHSKLVEFMNDLILEYQDENIRDQFNSAQTIHANFYHDFMDEELFKYHSRKTEELIERLIAILKERLAIDQR